MSDGKLFNSKGNERILYEGKMIDQYSCKNT